MKRLNGHVWGDRYWSKIVEGPPKGAEAYVFAAVVRPENQRVRRAVKAGGGGVPKSGGSAASPATGAEGRPRTGETARKGG
ncbi:MAG: hypothetical protein LBK61_01590 [Spirochaetaceae bacterium]|nr:hypothetical protein [Spirochaetaceae bacterium]